MNTEEHEQVGPPTESLLDSPLSGDDANRDQQNSKKKPSWSIPKSSLRLLRRLTYSKICDACSPKGKPFIERLRTFASLDNIPLLRDTSFEPGEEWIKGALLCAWGAGAILAVNIILTVIAVGISYTKPSNRLNVESLVLYQGSCSRTEGWKTGLHLLINILSTGLLAASNYVMQCLCAPSRAATDLVHATHGWLDIGTMSLRNFARMDNRRKILWVTLLMSSLPIHMLFNSAVFSSIATTSFDKVIIPTDLASNESLVASRDAEKFLNHTGFGAEDIRKDLSNGALHNISLADCYSKLRREFNTEIGLLLLATNRDYTYGLSRGPANDTNTEDLNDIWRYRYTGSMEVPRMRFYPQDWHVSGLKHWTYPVWSFRDPDCTGTHDLSDDWQRYDEYYVQRANQYYDGRMPKESYIDLDSLFNYVFIYNPDESDLRSYLNTTLAWYNQTWASQLAVRIDKPIGSDDWGSYASLDPQVYASYCLIKRADQHCGLYLNLPICLAVISANIIKITCMYMAARTRHKDILLTVGDALASFLDRPDVTAKDKCLISWSDLKGRSARESHPIERIVATSTSIPLMIMQAERATPGGAYSTILPRDKRWYHAVGWRRWTVAIVFFLTCLAASIFLYVLGITYSDFSDPFGSDRGIGQPSVSTMMFHYHSVTALVLIANSPQLVFSILYYLCNSILSCMLVAAEYNGFASQRKTLRVSWPRGLQRSTYYLSIPWRYGIPLLGISVSLHWMLSQSIFLVVIHGLDAGNATVDWTESDYQACGYSPLAMFLTLIILVVAMAVLGGLAMRPLRSYMPLAAHCSFAIAAACHPPGDDHEASLKPVMWGEVPQARRHDDTSDDLSNGSSSESNRDGHGLRYAHCTFTSKEVISPCLNRFYR
ncbi:hypothetical protein BDV33DRAFT_186594 [Aspergillus novoparasiticus]|uniref:DUF6536 domain-containing protein n=1 Tax=Aspergillus novoparasiticus TaxID=986946 RepID=A0A5N6F9H1_9EURO|nr:hypothetical protein BDV33DRAFT_186594 [Aspergillus novoparasiticus]